MDVQPPSVRRFGEFELELQSGQLWRAGAAVKLAAQPAKVLAILVAQPGRLVSREEIERILWGEGGFLGLEQRLNFCIRQIRLALRDDADNPRYIETYPKRGYRFIAAVEELRPAEGHRPQQRRAGSRRLLAYAVCVCVVAALGLLVWHGPPARTSVPGGRVLTAVLPFQVLNAGPDESYLGDGLTEELIAQLGAVEPDRLGVIARTSAMQYRNRTKAISEIGRELRVAYILQGTIRWAEGRVRISIQLIRVSDQSQIWSETFSRGISDGFAWQSDLSRAVAREVLVKLSPRGAPSAPGRVRTNARTYEAYLKGRYYWRTLDRAGIDKAIAEFQVAVENDPGYAPAYAGLADCYYALSNMRVEPATAMAKARSSAARALQIDPDLPEAHLSLALVKAFYDWDWAGADEHFQSAIALNPGFSEARGWYGAFLALMGRLDDSMSQLERAHELDPLSLTINWTMALPLYFAGRYEEALTQVRKTLELDPGFYMAYAGMGSTYEAKGDFAQAVAAFSKARELEDSPEMTAFLARAYAVSGNRRLALDLLGELKTMMKAGTYVSPFDISAIYAGLGDTSETLVWLEKSFQSRAEGMAGLRQDPRFRDLRTDSRFADLLNRMHFPPR